MSAKPFSLAVKAVIINDEGQTLLLRRSSANSRFVGCWEWPGGKVDPGEDFAAALLREAHEETGLDVDITGLAGATLFEMEKFNVVLLCLETRVTGGDLHLSHEHDKFTWAPLQELTEFRLCENLRDFMFAYADRFNQK